MNLQFITSVSKGYWESVGKHCIHTWNLPGEVIVYVDQQEGEIEWINEIPYKKKLLHVPTLDVADYLDVKTKVRKFWGKSCAQIHAIRNRPIDTRIVWLDADMEQTDSISSHLFDFDFRNPVALMKSHDTSPDCYETGLVIFNQQFEKLTLFANRYEKFWRSEEDLLGLFRPYDAMVLGNLAEQHKLGYYNLCDTVCENIDALKNTRYSSVFKHWINKDNKKKFLEEKVSQESENS